MILDVNNENIEEVLNSEGVVILKFSGEWCGPCKMLKPTILKLNEENTDNLIIGQVDVDTNMEIARDYKIRGVPTLIFFKDGIEVDRTSGLRSKEELQTKINDLTSEEKKDLI